MSDYITFKDIYQTVMKAIADTQYARIDEVKAVVNQIYLGELIPCDELYPLYWLLDCEDSKNSKAPATITGITAANPPVVTAAAHGFATGDLVSLYGIVGMTELNNRIFHATKVTANTFSLQDLSKASIQASGYTAYSSGGKANHRGLTITNCRKLLNAGWHGYSGSLGFVGPEQIDIETGWMDSSTSRPLKIMHRQVYPGSGSQYDYLLWFQGSDAAYDLRYWYEKQVPRLVNDTDVPYLPAQFHDAIIAGSVMRLGENKTQVEAGVVWPGIYQKHIEAIKAMNRDWWSKNKPYERSGPFLA